MLHIAASAEKLSEHPLGKAIVASCDGNLYEASDFKVIAGRGISASVQGKNILAGKADFKLSERVDIQWH
ncbi:MAG: cation-transporting P-type ATPase, partial [Lachnospiraceae bacterium]|nr:cation-transporting P-type ATPase [Lachnospiraceae bacterium]